MAENALQTAQTFVQDVLAPDVREIKVKITGLDKRIDGLDKRMDGFDKRMDGLDRRIDLLERHMSDRFESLDKRLDERFAAVKDQSDYNMRLVVGAIERLALMSENSGLRAVADLRERVAVLEARAA